MLSGIRPFKTAFVSEVNFMMAFGLFVFYYNFSSDTDSPVFDWCRFGPHSVVFYQPSSMVSHDPMVCLVTDCATVGFGASVCK